MSLASPTAPTPSSSTAAAQGLLQRLIPTRTHEFTLEIATDLNAKTFEILGGGVRPVTLRGASSGSIASAFNWYLKHHCHCHVSWCGSNLNLPAHLPAISSPIRIESPYDWRYYFNYCTFSYSMAFWDWARWEREIDWMALSGINLPLAITGQEAVWQKVYHKLGLSDVDLAAFFAGPAFLAWGWMGNLDGWGGPMPQSWIDGQRDLQRKILARQRAFGMKPALPSLTGHVPPAFTTHFPSAKVRQMELWAEMFPGTFVLEPEDPMFQQVGQLFIEEQRTMFGDDTDDTGIAFFSCDTFNENSPPNDDPAYLDAMGKSVYRAMNHGDRKAVWVVQDWMFHFNPTNPGYWKPPQIAAFLNSVPNDRMLVLDLHSDAHPLGNKTDWFSGKPWVWCFLHSFGGHQSMFGHLARLAHDPPAALRDPKQQHLTGFGLTPEGIEQNPVMYDLATDMMWRRDQPDLDQWLTSYIQRRYGKVTPQTLAAWQVLNQTAYSRPPENGGTVRTLVNMPPRLDAERVGLNYSPADLIPAWDCLAQAAADLSDSDGFRFDLVDTARQVLTNFSTAIHARAVAAYHRKDTTAVSTEAARFNELLLDIDTLLATRREFLLGNWIAAARAWGNTDSERDFYEHNARTQISVWGHPTGMLRDYARKEWSGIIRDVYAVRWQKFFAELQRCIREDAKYDHKAFQQPLCLAEDDWARAHNPYPAHTIGDPIAVSAALLKKYHPIFADYYRRHPNLLTNKPATASPTTQSGHSPAMALTGIADRASFWSTSESPAWLQVDLEAPTPVASVHLFPYWDGSRHYGYSVETSLDGQSWSTAVDEAENSTPASADGFRHHFPPRPTRFLRVNILRNSANRSAHLLDVRAYGPDSR